MTVKQQRSSQSPARRSPRKTESALKSKSKRKAEEEAIMVDDSSSDAVEVIDPPKADMKRRKVDAVEDVKKVSGRIIWFPFHLVISGLF